MPLAGLVAGTKQHKYDHLIGFAMGHVFVAGAFGAGAVSGECFNPAMIMGREVASILLACGYCLVC